MKRCKSKKVKGGMTSSERSRRPLRQNASNNVRNLSKGLKVVSSVKRSKDKVLEKLRTAKNKANSASHNISNALDGLQSSFNFFENPRPIKNQTPKFTNAKISEMAQLLSEVKAKTIDAFSEMRKTGKNMRNNVSKNSRTSSNNMKIAAYYFSVMRKKSEEALKKLGKIDQLKSNESSNESSNKDIDNESMAFNKYIENMIVYFKNAFDKLENSSKLVQNHSSKDVIQEMKDLMTRVKKTSI